MKLEVDVSNYIPKNTDKKNFSHVYMHEPQENELLETRGKLFSAIDIKSKDEVDLTDIINNFLDDLESEYFSDEVASIVNILDKSITNAYEKLSNKIVELNLSGSVDFNIGCLVIWGDIAYMARIGNSSICLYRESKLMNLSEHLLAVGNSVVSTASGYVKDEDIFLLSASNISISLSDDQIKDICIKTQEEINNLDIEGNNISFLTLKIKSNNKEIGDEILSEAIIEDIDNDESQIASPNEHIDSSKEFIEEQVHPIDRNIEEERKINPIKSSLNDFDLKSKSKKASSYIINTTKDVSLNIYKNVNENMKKINWSGILKSIITVIISFFQLIFNSIMYLKDRTQKQYKLKVNRDIVTLKKEKNTVFGIIIFIVLIILIFYFFF